MKSTHLNKYYTVFMFRIYALSARHLSSLKLQAADSTTTSKSSPILATPKDNLLWAFGAEHVQNAIDWKSERLIRIPHNILLTPHEYRLAVDFFSVNKVNLLNRLEPSKLPDANSVGLCSFWGHHSLTRQQVHIQILTKKIGNAKLNVLVLKNIRPTQDWTLKSSKYFSRFVFSFADDRK